MTERLGVDNFQVGLAVVAGISAMLAILGLANTLLESVYVGVAVTSFALAVASRN